MKTIEFILNHNQNTKTRGGIVSKPIGLEGAAVFTRHGGYVVIEDLTTFKFDSSNIADKNNFLVVFLAKHFENLVSIDFYDAVIKYNPPQKKTFSYEYLEYDDGVIKKTFYDSTVSHDDIEDAGISVFDFAKYTQVKVWTKFSKNPAINEILNYNEVTEKAVTCNHLVQAIHQSILKGHTEIPDDIRGTYWKVYGVSGRFKSYQVSEKSFKGNGKSKVFKIPE